MFKVGDKVRCIVVDSENEFEKLTLTKNNYYIVKDISKKGILIINDCDHLEYYDHNHFELVKNDQTKKKMKFVPMSELEVVSVNGIDGILIPE